MSWPLNTIVAIVLVGVSFRIGYDRGLAKAPEFQLKEDKFIIETLEKSLIYLRNMAQTPEECLSIVTDGNVDFGSFCAEYMSNEDLRLHDPASDDRDQYQP